GSMNPTENGVGRNNNNLILIGSQSLASLYQDEFDELWAGEHGGGATTKHVFQASDHLQVYFCPEDDCVTAIVAQLETAQHSIYFMIFSFTHDRIGTHLALAKERGVHVEGLMEKQQLSKYSMHKFFLQQDIPIVLENTGAFLHHKVFIIDEETIITGSFNPSQNAAERNDENVIIIKNREFAGRFLEEYQRLRTQFTDV
ncbi:MAG: phospholipase D-like domain-containing protein, partial [Nanoarchaeota archaeon]